MFVRNVLAALAIVLLPTFSVAKDSHAAADASEVSKCKKDNDCDEGVCIGWSGYGKKYSGMCGAKASGPINAMCSRNLECESTHCISGVCMDSGKDCSDGVRKPGCDYEIVLDRSEGEELGIKVSLPSLVITSIDDGLVQKWNDKHKETHVKTSDRIVAINGHKFWSDDCVKEAGKKKKLKMTLMVGKPLPEQKEEKWQTLGHRFPRQGGTSFPLTRAAALSLGTCSLLAVGFVLWRRRSAGAAEAKRTLVDSDGNHGLE